MPGRRQPPGRARASPGRRRRRANITVTVTVTVSDRRPPGVTGGQRPRTPGPSRRRMIIESSSHDPGRIMIRVIMMPGRLSVRMPAWRRGPGVRILTVTVSLSDSGSAACRRRGRQCLSDRRQAARRRGRRAAHWQSQCAGPWPSGLRVVTVAASDPGHLRQSGAESLSARRGPRYRRESDA